MKQERLCIVYGYRNRLTDKWYIGECWEDLEIRRKQGHKNRYRRYERNVETKPMGKFYSAIKKYGGLSNFDTVWEYVVLERNISKTTIYEREVFWGTQYDSVESGYNHKLGGDGKSILSMEVRNRMSISKKGIPLKEETKRLMSIARKGKKQTESHRLAGILARTGRKLSKEHRDKISKLKSGDNGALCKPIEYYADHSVGRKNFKKTCAIRKWEFDKFHEIYSGVKSKSGASRFFYVYDQNKTTKTTIDMRTTDVLKYETSPITRSRFKEYCHRNSYDFNDFEEIDADKEMWYANPNTQLKTKTRFYRKK